MSNKEQGMNPEACASYSLADRFTCAKCGGTPKLVDANVKDPSLFSIKLRCCQGETTWNGAKSSLVFTQTIFDE